LETSSAGTTKHSILGYLAKEDRVYLVDKSLLVTSYSVMLAVLQYQTAVMRGDFEAANELLCSIPESEYTTVARFLESQGFKEEAMAVTTDPDHKFDLAMELGQTDVAHSLLLETPEEDKDTTDTMAKWKRLSDGALKDNNFELCEAASLASNDFAGLLLMYSAIGNLTGMESLAKSAQLENKTNIAFVSYFLSGNVEQCIAILLETKRFPEAAFFARTYLPSRIPDIVSLWRNDLAKTSQSAANSLASPETHPEQFPDMDLALQVEQMFLEQRSTKINAADYLTAKDDLELNLIALLKSRQTTTTPIPTTDNNNDNDNDPAVTPSDQKQEEEQPVTEDDEAPAVEAKRLAEEAQAAAAVAAEAAKKAEEEAKVKDENMDDFGDDW
jgi:coatomer subunit beta'